MKNLDRTKTQRKEVFLDLALRWLGPLLIVVQARLVKTQNELVHLEQIAIMWCQPYI